MPPATFEFLVFSLRTQAEMSMGLIDFGEDEPAPEPDLEVARHTVDMLGVLQEKTKGNLSLEEELLLSNTLAEMQFRYLQATAEPGTEEPSLLTRDDDRPRIIIP